VLTEKLVNPGFAVLRVDDRGIGSSSGSADFTTFDDAVADARAAVTALRSQPGIDPRRLFLVGHSEGGLVAATVARGTPVAGAVMLAGPGCPIDELLHDQSATFARAAGSTDVQIAHERTMNEAVFRIAVSPMEEEVARAAAAAVIAEHLRTWPAPLPPSEGYLGETSRVRARVVVSPSFRRLLRQQPATVLRRLTCPVLAVFGEKDTQVSPALNCAPVQEAIAVAAVPGSMAVVLSGLNHLFQQAGTGLIDKYESIDHVMHDRAVDLVADWLHGLGRTTSSA
jgi:uncharacterized protein